MKFLITAVALTLSCVTTQAFAQSQTAPKEMAKEVKAEMSQDSAKESCCSASKEDCNGECPVSLAMAKLPKMTYKVGAEESCCSQSAAKLAEESNEAIHYVVAKKEYEDKTEAMTALVEQTEAMVEAFITPCKCETSGKTTVAGETCSCPIQGEQNAALVKAAVDAVNVSYKVGEEACDCQIKAKELAANSDSKLTYVVDGEETCCSMTARLQTARAKYKAAVQAIANATKQSAGQESNS
jgi:hypothetical protein